MPMRFASRIKRRMAMHAEHMTRKVLMNRQLFSARATENRFCIPFFWMPTLDLMICIR